MRLSQFPMFSSLLGEATLESGGYLRLASVVIGQAERQTCKKRPHWPTHCTSSRMSYRDGCKPQEKRRVSLEFAISVSHQESRIRLNCQQSEGHNIIAATEKQRESSKDAKNTRTGIPMPFGHANVPMLQTSEKILPRGPRLMHTQQPPSCAPSRAIIHTTSNAQQPCWDGLVYCRGICAIGNSLATSFNLFSFLCTNSKIRKNSRVLVIQNKENAKNARLLKGCDCTALIF
jgi:hypothetical protein